MTKKMKKIKQITVKHYFKLMKPNQKLMLYLVVNLNKILKLLLTLYKMQIYHNLAKTII